MRAGPKRTPTQKRVRQHRGRSERAARQGRHRASGAEVGPYARLRPGADLAEGVKVGNFVEVKNVTMDKGAKANHLAYLGDGAVGAGAR